MTSVTDNSGAKPEFDQLYEFGSEIGKGRYASVKKCICKKTKKVYAAKVIKKLPHQELQIKHEHCGK